MRILFSLCSYNFVKVDKAYDAFTSIMLNIETSDENIVFNENLIIEDDFKPFIEWLCVSLAYF